MSCQAQTKFNKRCIKDPQKDKIYCWIHRYTIPPKLIIKDAINVQNEKLSKENKKLQNENIELWNDNKKLSKEIIDNKKIYTQLLTQNGQTYQNSENNLLNEYNKQLAIYTEEYNILEKNNISLKLVNDKCMSKINDLKNEIILVRELNAKLILNDKQKQFEKIERFEYIKQHLKLLLNKDFSNLIKLEEYLLDINNKDELEKIFQKKKKNYYKYYNELRIKRNNICHPEL